MKLIVNQQKITGVSVPVSALRSEQSCGVGEFLDLLSLGDFCVRSGISLIQILPVNDTGGNLSPYSAHSAFALHPIYLHLDSLDGASHFDKEIEMFRKSTAYDIRLNYNLVYQFKMNILHKIYNEKKDSIETHAEMLSWMKENSWVTEYAVYSTLKQKNEQKSWLHWPENEKNITAGDIERLFSDNREDAIFYVWLQYELDNQLAIASKGLEEKGIFLKGDIPILMGEDSADIWFHPQYFDRRFTAGAPPDMFSVDGQNWGFPVYDWKRLAGNQYSWWLKRLAHFGKFFQAVRLDHVIGFLRIWQIPVTDISGTGGHFFPSAFITEKSLMDAGFQREEVKMFTAPLQREEFCRRELGEDFPAIASRYLELVGNGFYTLHRDLNSQRAILALEEKKSIISFLIKMYFNRILLRVEEGYSPSWYYYQSEYFYSLPQQKKDMLQQIIALFYTKSELVWERNGREILGTLAQAGDFLLCAEDLGAVPQCTARILQDLGMLGLKVGRWSRKYDEPGQPFFHPDEFPFLSVVTTSVHDSSSLRAWWEEDSEGRQALYQQLDVSGDCPQVMDTSLAFDLLSYYLKTNSFICMLPIQDLLSVSEKFRAVNPEEERINIPGIVNETNWTWRMPASMEELLLDNDLLKKTEMLTSLRKHVEVIKES